VYIPVWGKLYQKTPNDQQSPLMPVMKECLELRRKLVIPLIANLTTNWLEHGEPIIRPMWYDQSENKDNASLYFHIHDQFMLGPDYVVAPIVKVDTKSREVHLPAGKWKQHGPVVNGTDQGKLREGPEKFTIENVPFTGLPVYFERIP